MFSLNYIITIIMFLMITIAMNTSYKYYNYNNIFYKLYNAKQSSYWLKVQYLTTPIDIYTLLSNYINEDTQHNRVIEYTSLTNLKDKWLNNLNKYKEPKIIIQYIKHIAQMKWGYIN